jgi:hypothetical protein
MHGSSPNAAGKVFSSIYCLLHGADALLGVNYSINIEGRVPLAHRDLRAHGAEMLGQGFIAAAAAAPANAELSVLPRDFYHISA